MHGENVCIAGSGGYSEPKHVTLGNSILILKYIVPFFTFGLEMLWEHLTENNLKTLENIKVTFLKKVLRASRFTSL
jgi:hypothetical protein